MLVELLNAETGARGYALTEDESFLEPYNRASPRMQGLIDELSALTSDNPSQRTKIEAFRPQVDARMEELHRIVALMRQGQRGEAIVVAKSGSGKALMEDIRAGLDRVFGEETRLLSLRQVRARALRGWVLGMIGLCLLSAVGLGLLTLRAMLHYVDRLEDEARRRRQTEETLRQSQRLEAVGQLTGGIAHDFNNLLTIIVGNLDTIKRRVAQDTGDLAARLKGLVDNALEGARSSVRLTQQLLAFSRRQALDPQRVDLNRVVSGMSDLLRRTLGETVDVETVLAGGLWPTYADANQLENALINLAANARDAMPGGGKITIETANSFLDEAYASQFGDVSAGQYVLMSVTDTGAPAAAEPAPIGEIRAREGETILLVEDNDGVRAYAKATLEELGYRVLEASTAKQGLNLLDGARRVDLLFTDVVLPGGMSGRQLADVVQRQRPSLPVLFTTGYTRNAIVHHGRLDPNVNLLNKPFTQQDLARKVRSMLNAAARDRFG